MANKQKPTIIHIIGGLTVGGTERKLQRLVTSQQDYKSIVISLKSNGPISHELREQDITVHDMDFSRNLNSVFKVQALKQIIKENDPALIQSWMYAADLITTIACRSINVPHLWNVRQSQTGWIKGQYHIAANQRINAKLSRLSSLFKGTPSKIVYCANAARESHEAIGYRSGKGQVIVNGIDTSRFRHKPDDRLNIRRNLGLSSGDKLLIMVGRFDPIKNHERFLKVVSYLSKRCTGTLKAALIGSDINDDNTALANLIDSLGVREHVHLMGEQSDMPAVYSSADALLLTSNSEGWPNVIAESMACQTPALATEAGDSANIIGNEDRSFWHSDENNLVESLAEQCLSILSLPEEQRRKQGELARQRIIENYSLNDSISRYSELYAEQIEMVRQ